MGHMVRELKASLGFRVRRCLKSKAVIIIVKINVIELIKIS